MWIKQFGWLIFCVVILPGCVSFRTPDPLSGTEWALVEINTRTPQPNTMVSIQFQEGKVSGSGGCNGYFGEYQLKGKTISFQNMGITEMACMPLEVMNQEQDFQTALLRTSKFQLNAGILSFIDKDGTELLRFAPKGKDQ